MPLYVVCTAGEFVWNEVGAVQLPAPYITLCDFLYTNLIAKTLFEVENVQYFCLKL